MNAKMEQIKSENTVELASIIATGSIEEIERFVAEKFHQIKHTQSFNIILERLRNLMKAHDCVKASADRRGERVRTLEQFIRNGVGLGYITMPNKGDPARDIIDEIIPSIRQRMVRINEG